MPDPKKVYLPQQEVRRGVAGYKDKTGNIVVVDPRTRKEQAAAGGKKVVGNK